VRAIGRVSGAGKSGNRRLKFLFRRLIAGDDPVDVDLFGRASCGGLLGHPAMIREDGEAEIERAALERMQLCGPGAGTRRVTKSGDIAIDLGQEDLSDFVEMPNSLRSSSIRVQSIMMPSSRVIAAQDTRAALTGGCADRQDLMRNDEFIGH